MRTARSQRGRSLNNRGDIRKSYSFRDGDFQFGD